MSRESKIREMQRIAKERGGECLSREYINNKTKLQWKCKEGHEWEAIPNSIKRGRWCPICGIKRRSKSQSLTIEEMQEIAKSRGGVCLSKEYVNHHIKLRWRCKEGHEWEAEPKLVKINKTWCPQCVGHIKLSIEEMQKIAKERGGECLSNIYINSQTKLKWRCKEGHEWEAKPNPIKRGHWCPYCAGRHQTIEDMQKIAKERGGICLSDRYINNRTNLRWRCKEGHEWEAKPNYVKLGTWCAICAGKAKLSIEEMQQIANKRGGECLSEEYIDNKTKLTWKCEIGHIWEATPFDIKDGTWCPICSSGLSERICRYVFEKLFNKKFPKRNPRWLINPETNSYMQLDGYCKELGIAFEYQGIQHYLPTTFFHQTKEEFDQRVNLDKLKKELCDRNNVTLIEIPYFIEKEEIPNHIIRECRKKGIKISKVSLDIFDYKTFRGIYSPRHLKEIQEIAKSRGGECLSNKYYTSHTKMKWRCEKGHVWETAPVYIKSGTWCPYCARNVRLTIEEMQRIAKERGGECLSTEYINSDTKLRWKCKEGHEWEAKPNSVKINKTWCLICSGSKKATIYDMKAIAKERGGECLSTEYINSMTKLRWRCKEGHVWKTKPNTIKSGHWCPYCAGRHQTIEDMQKIAKERGGECLSNIYINSKTKVKWQCKEGHTWEADPSHIKRGTWCPICARGKGKSKEYRRKFAEFEKNY